MSSYKYLNKVNFPSDIKRLSIGSNPGSRIMVVKSNAFGGDGLSALAAALIKFGTGGFFAKFVGEKMGENISKQVIQKIIRIY